APDPRDRMRGLRGCRTAPTVPAPAVVKDLSAFHRFGAHSFRSRRWKTRQGARARWSDDFLLLSHAEGPAGCRSWTDEAPARRAQRMNLDEPGKPHGEPLAPANWTMKMLQEANQYVAVVMLDGEPRCRVSIAAADQDEATARTALAEKARHW